MQPTPRARIIDVVWGAILGIVAYMPLQLLVPGRWPAIGLAIIGAIGVWYLRRRGWMPTPPSR